jgi:hypothetical protein
MKAAAARCGIGFSGISLAAPNRILIDLPPSGYVLVLIFPQYFLHPFQRALTVLLN